MLMYRTMATEKLFQSYYQDLVEFQASAPTTRGTITLCIGYIKEKQAIELKCEISVRQHAQCTCMHPSTCNVHTRTCNVHTCTCNVHTCTCNVHTCNMCAVNFCLSAAICFWKIWWIIEFGGLTGYSLVLANNVDTGKIVVDKVVVD